MPPLDRLKDVVVQQRIGALEERDRVDRTTGGDAVLDPHGVDRPSATQRNGEVGRLSRVRAYLARGDELRPGPGASDRPADDAPFCPPDLSADRATDRPANGAADD